MPTYEFECNKCGHGFEVLLSMSEKDKAKCPKCKGFDITQIFTSVQIKGSKGASSCTTCRVPTCITCPVKE